MLFRSTGHRSDVYLPSPSYWPIVVAVGLPIIGYGLIYNLWLCVVGGLFVVMGLFGWAQEPADDPDAAHEDHDEPESGDDGLGASALEESTTEEVSVDD